MEPIIDFKQSVALVGGKEDLARKLLQMFIDELPEAHQEFKQSWHKRDLKKLREHIHKLYGACCYVSVPPLMELLTELRTFAKANNQEQVGRLMDLFDAKVNAIHAAYQQMNMSIEM